MADAVERGPCSESRSPHSVLHASDNMLHQRRAIRARVPEVTARLLQHLQAEGPEAAAPPAAAQQAGQGYGAPCRSKPRHGLSGNLSARSICIFLALMPHLVRCCCRRLGHTLRVPSQSSQPPRSWRSPRRSSGSSCYDACDYRWLWRHAHALFGDASTRLVPTRLRVQKRACLPPALGPPAGSRARVPGSWRSGCTERACGGHEHRCAGLRRRRIEVVANGLPLWHGSQQAINATIVSAVTREGEAQPWGRPTRPSPR